MFEMESIMTTKKLSKWVSEVSNGKSIAISSRIKEIHPLIERIVKNLVLLEPMKYIWIGTDTILASNEVKLAGRRWTPISTAGHPTAIGLHLILEFDLNSVQFYDITSYVKGNGERMLKAILDAIEPDWEVVIVMDYSKGFWRAMSKKYEQVIVF